VNCVYRINMLIRDIIDEKTGDGASIEFRSLSADIDMTLRCIFIH